MLSDEHIHVMISSEQEAVVDEEANESINSSVENVITFPCTGRHLFHLDCLLDWLVVVTRRSGKMTCPCCREEPTFVQVELKEEAVFPSRSPCQPSELHVMTASTAV